jgi:8-oxo-dGTP pyrophosphatase MutT (NUDIX family)
VLRYLEPAGPLKPADAVAAIIIDDAGKYLVQLRDAKPTIFFPDHWGCFGGAAESGETELQCLARELQEEIELDIGALPVRHFTTFSFDFGFAGGSVIRRTFYEVRATAAALGNLTLREGREMGVFAGPQLLAMQVVPYDRFALWMHCYKAELAAPETAGK